MSNFTMINQQPISSSICPANGRRTVGDGAFSADMTPSVLAVCHIQGNDSMYYYSTTFSGGPGVSFTFDRSLCGVFDIPNAKCPPDRGSSDWVTASLAPTSPSSSPSDRSTLSSFSSESFKDSNSYPNNLPFDYTADGALRGLPFSTPPRDILNKRPAISPAELSTPALTPDDNDESDGGSISGMSAKEGNEALDFLSTLFPKNALGALPYAKKVTIDAPDLGASFDGVVLSLPGKPKTFYVDGKSAAHVNLRESIVALLDLADERLECTALVLALEKSSPLLSDLLHAFMYVGGTVVTTPPFPVDPAYVLVGMEI
ncbi:ornithine decarboxylase antizyme-domain-containing protein [Irpex rosettiformis]|uniref:Ornithine decarboxylase antizyme-domain-containing protein n=1 Tax=Irpex rosettiformis TaxID=378272 RepID=A0ACB8UGL0_9APHY|nr:ornithine decarboxylase antizyme-domain-containing protein [Irpex rosettiformis]